MVLFAAPGRHFPVASTKSSLFCCQDVETLEVLLQEQVWVCEIKSEHRIWRWSPEAQAIVEDRIGGTRACDKHLVDLDGIPVLVSSCTVVGKSTPLPQFLAVAEITSLVTLRE